MFTDVKNCKLTQGSMFLYDLSLAQTNTDGFNFTYFLLKCKQTLMVTLSLSFFLHRMYFIKCISQDIKVLNGVEWSLEIRLLFLLG